jgi:hypothetical protein
MVFEASVFTKLLAMGRRAFLSHAILRKGCSAPMLSRRLQVATRDHLPVTATRADILIWSRGQIKHICAAHLHVHTAFNLSDLFD